MNKQMQSWLPMLAASLALCLPPLAHGQGTSLETPAGVSEAQNMKDMKFGPLPGLPTCLSGAVESGDPFKGASFILIKLAKGCTIPWHWHTAGEYVMMVSGTARVDMAEVESKTLMAGDFARFPSHHIHQFSCTNECTLFLHTDATFDIHYANKAGNEIPAEDALKPFKEKPAPKM